MGVRAAEIAARLGRAVALVLVSLFFLFPIFWILLMSFQTNADILRTPPSLFFSPTLDNYGVIFAGRMETSTGDQEIAFFAQSGQQRAFVVAFGFAGAFAGGARGLRFRAL